MAATKSLVGHEIVRVGLLEIEQVLAACLDQAVDVEHGDARLRGGLAQTFQHHRLDDHAGDPGAGRAGAEKHDALVLELPTLHAQRAEKTGERGAGRSLDVVVVAADPVAIAVEQTDGIDTRPILEVDAAGRKHLLHRTDELVDEAVALGDGDARAAQTQIERVVEQALVVGAEIEHHRQQALRRHGGARRVELQLADRDAHAVGAEIAEAQDALAAGHADEANVLLGPVAQDLLHASLVVDGDVHAARAPEDVVELQAGLADGRVIDDRQEAGRIRHQGAVEQRLVLVEQPDQVDVAIEIGGLVSELLKDAPQLHVLVLDDIRQQTSQTQRLALGEREGCGLVEAAVLEEVHAALARKPFGGIPCRVARHHLFQNAAPADREVDTFVSPSRLSISASSRGMCARAERGVNCRRHAPQPAHRR